MGAHAYTPKNVLYQRSHSPGNEKERLQQRNKQQYLPVNENRYLLLSFYDTYIYLLLYIKIYLLCVAAAPHFDKYLPEQMTISFVNDNDIIVYALERIIDYARKNQYIFIAQGVWWIASTIGLESGLVQHIDSLCLETSQTSLQEDSRIDKTDSELEQSCDKILNQAEQFINESKKQQAKDLVDSLRRTRKGKLLPAKITEWDRNRLNQLIQVSRDQVRSQISSQGDYAQT